MKLNEKEKKGVLVLVLLFVVYTLIVLAVPFAKGGMFWLTYLFTAAAFGVQAYVFKLSFEKEAGAKSKFYGFPIARVGVLYLAVQLVLGLVFMALAAVAPVWLALVLYLALLAAAAVGVIATDSIRDEVERQDTQLKRMLPRCAPCSPKPQPCPPAVRTQRQKPPWKSWQKNSATATPSAPRRWRIWKPTWLPLWKNCPPL